MRKIDTTRLDSLSTSIAELPARSTKTPYQVVEQLANVIDAALERGQDCDAVVELLRKAGVELAPKTVQNYLRRARRKLASALGPDASPMRLQSPTPRDQGGPTPRTIPAEPPDVGTRRPGTFVAVPDTRDI